MDEVHTLCNGRWLRLQRRGRWEYAERTHKGGAVLIIAVNDRDELLLVEQFRPAVAASCIEMPAGLVGDSAEFAGEDALTAAHRELLEETGYRAKKMELLFAGPPSAGMSSENIAFALASELNRETAGGGDATEDIHVHEVPMTKLLSWLATQASAGKQIDPKIFSALYLLEHDIRLPAAAGQQLDQ